MVPHPRNVHVPSYTSRTGTWSPCPQMLSSINSSNIKTNGFETKPPKPTFDECFIMSFAFFHETVRIPRLIRTFWYKGFGRKQGKMTSSKKTLSPKNSSSDLKTDFPNKSKTYEIDISQMHCKCYTRYALNPTYEFRK